MESAFVRGSLPIAVILLTFDDIDVTDPAIPSKERIESFFAASTTGGLGEYCRDISLGNINIDGTQVFGWWRMKYSYYKDAHDPIHNHLNETHRRVYFVAEARRLAALNNVNLAPFRGGLAVFINGLTDGGNDGEKTIITSFLGEWWGQPKWENCGKCGMLFYAGGSSTGTCPESGFHAGTGAYFSLALNVPGYTGEEGWRRCVKCLGLFSLNAENDGSDVQTCPVSGRHDPGNGSTASYPFVLSFDPDGGFISRNLKRCIKCHVLVWTGGSPDLSTTGTCTVEWSGRMGKRHVLNSDKLYSITQYFSSFHTTFVAHEFGHTIGMAESFRKRSDKEIEFLKPEKGDIDHIYGDKWDIMSANNVFAYEASQGAAFTQGGPRLTAASLLKLGWIRKNNILTFTAAGNTSKQLRIALTALNHQLTGPDDDKTLVVRIVSPYHVYTVEYRKKSGWDRAIPQETVLIHELRSDYMLGEKGWKVCLQCSSLWSAASLACAGGDVHVYRSDSQYVLSTDAAEVQNPQLGWRNCKKCRCIWFTKNPDSDGVCSAGGGHQRLGEREFALSLKSNAATFESGWRWCNKCQVLFRGENKTEAGECPVGGHHNATGSSNYAISQRIGSVSGWRHCLKCQSLVSEAYGHCVNGNRHTNDENTHGAYAVCNNDFAHPGQEGWKRCIKCYQLVFSLNGPGVCPGPDGGGHSYATGEGSQYKLMSGLPADVYGGRVSGWKWCSKCQALSHAPANNNCAASGKHDFSGSADYVLTPFNGDYTFLVGRNEQTGNGTEYEWVPGQTFKSPDEKISIYIDRFATTTDTTVLSLRYKP